MGWVSDHSKSTHNLSGCIWNDTVVPFLFFSAGRFEKGRRLFSCSLLKSEVSSECVP